MPQHLIATCHHCRQEFPTVRANAKWCPRDRTVRALLALAQRPRTCIVCSKDFYPQDRAQRICASCLPWEPSKKEADGPRECYVCHRRDRLHPGLPLCDLCAERAEPESFHGKVVKALLKWQEATRATSAEPVPPPRQDPDRLPVPPEPAIEI